MQLDNTADRAAPKVGNNHLPGYATDMTVGSLDWHAEERGGACVIAPSGRVDESTAKAFARELVAAIGKQPAKLVIDLAKIDFMSSHGLRALTIAQRAAAEAQTTIVLARPTAAMREILAISRYDMVIRITETIEDAIGH